MIFKSKSITIFGNFKFQRSYKQKMFHLGKVTPLMLDLYFTDNRGDSENRINGKAASRVADRFKANFDRKHKIVESLWDECEKADLDTSQLTKKLNL